MARGADSEPGQLVSTVVAGYRLEGLIGIGGMGTVYGAIGPDGQPCALKLLNKGVSDTTLVRRFLRESKLAFAHTNPHIVPVLDAGVHDDTPFLVMPRLEGQDVKQLLAEVGALGPVTAARICVQACAGLAALHAEGIIHRDVKPSNIFLATEADDSVVVKICDFGVAKTLTAEEHTQLTATGAGLGSPHYMSPEQARDSKHVDSRSDIWSLAVTLYKMLAGKVPYDDTYGIGQYLLSITRRDPRSVQEHAPWVSPGLTTALHRGLQRDIDKRWQSAAEFADGLRPFIGGDERLTLKMLGPVDARTKTTVAARAELPRGSGGATGTTMTTSPGSQGKAELEALVERVLGGKYRVVRSVGRGGMGAVLEVTTPDGTRAAVKVIDRRQVGEGDHTFQRFLREAKAASSIQSDHVVRILDVGQDTALEAPYIVMELLEGVDLGSLFKQSAPIEPEPLVRAFIQAARGLAAAHAKGIVHRDVKPANLFAHEVADGDAMVVKVCDFGIAKRAPIDGAAEASHELTQTGGMLGSPMYMSPEQAVNAKRVDHHTDIWSLSISLYEGLSGRKVWGGRTTLGEIILAICTQPIPPLTAVAPWIDPALAAVVHRGLASKPEDRWPTIEAMATALEPFAGGTTELQRGDLVGVPDHLRAQIVTPTPPPPDRLTGTILERQASTGGATAGGVTVRGTAEKPRRTSLITGVAVVGLLCVGGALYAMRAGRQVPIDAAPGAIVTPSEAPSGTAQVVRYSARLGIEPPGATVQVNGVDAKIVDGSVLLDGEPGQAFDVVVSSHGSEERVRVLVSNDGRAVPDRVEVKPAGSGEPKVKTAGKKHTDGANAAPTGEPAAPSAAPTAQSSASPDKPTFRNTW